MGSQVQFDKIYRRIDSRQDRASARVTLPSIEILDLNNSSSTATVDLYLSNKPDKPASINDMVKSDIFEASNIYGIQVLSTWLCFKKQNSGANLELYAEGGLTSEDDSFYDQ